METSSKVYEVTAEVIHGRKIGRLLGFPTANMEIDHAGDIPNGVYRSEIEVDGVLHAAMSNVGVCPSVGECARRLETNIFDFYGNLYGRVLTVRLLERIRDERRFSSIDELKRQLEYDRILILNRG